MIPVFRPSMDANEEQALIETIRSGWIGNGPKTKEFENRFADLINVPHAIALNSATAALHLAMVLADVKGNEVITTPMTFVSTNHAILYAGGIPVFVDIEPDTLNIDPELIELSITEKTKAVIVVHYGGHSCKMDRINQIAKKHNLLLIEDVAHGTGGKYKTSMLGSIGDFGCFSFHAVKNLATGDGGMLTCKNDEYANRARKLSWMGISRGTWDRVDGEEYSWKYDVEELGFKYQMNDIAASIGLVQLSKLDEVNEIRRHLAERYSEGLGDLDWIKVPKEKEYAKSSWHNYVIKVNDSTIRNPLIDHLKNSGISTGMHYIPNHLYTMYKPYVKQSLPIAEKLWQELITLPLFPDLSVQDQDRIISSIRDFAKQGHQKR